MLSESFSTRQNLKPVYSASPLLQIYQIVCRYSPFHKNLTEIQFKNALDLGKVL